MEVILATREKVSP